ncbi:MAG: DUF2341 domain-containing protein [Desulfocapsaceae bacterium]|nr:DUF2341 domain-containing protein [Desulfocapsaceae bacterium]
MKVFKFFKQNRLHDRSFLGLGVTVFCALFLYATTASAWWDDNWKLRRSIDFDTTAQNGDIQEAVANVPILIRLHPGNFDFKKAKPDGGDIRFVASDDKTMLKYEIDTFDTINEIALIWVKVPELKANSQDNHILVYYGNDKAVDSQDKIGVFSNGQALVYHLSETQGPPQDVTVNKNNASHFSGGQALPSVVGSGISLIGGKDGITVPSSPSLSFAEGFTLSAWIKINHQVADGYLFSQMDQGKGIIVGVDGPKVYTRIANGGTAVQAESSAGLSQNEWHHLAVTARPGGKLSLFIDGQEVAGAPLPDKIPMLTADLVFGAPQGEGHQLAADLDEIEISGQVRSAAWIKTLFASQGMQGKLVGYGPEVSGGGGGLNPAVYMKTIAANITFDGWAVICILVFLGSCAMLVLVSKTIFFYLTGKSNKAFWETFTQLESPVAHDVELDNFDNSPLYRIYQFGHETITAMFQNKGNAVHPLLTVKEIDFFKASLERSYIQETKRFNNWMMILPLAISGGPFLGLLGTVWGVMNTFAGMAQAGDANIMAIAPGVASALAATVCGLLVAIPSLFGYNYLSGKMKDQTADMGIFIDEFIMLVDRDHGEEK